MLVRLQPKTVEVEYNILLSPVYQVPVLHFFLRSSRFLGSDSLKPIYEYLVPEAYRSELEHVGVMGGISMTVSVMFPYLQDITYRSAGWPVRLI